MKRILSASMVVGLAVLFGPRMQAAAQITLQPGPQQQVPSGLAASITAGDFNGDGLADIALNTRKDVTVLLSNPDGSLTSGLNIILSGASSLRGLVADDLNGDSFLDLAVVDFLRGSVYRIGGRGDGTFNPAQSFASGLRNAVDLAVGELDGKNGHDVAVAHSSSNAATVLLNTGSTGKYVLQLVEDQQGVRTFSLGRTPVDIKFADVNSDGLADMISVNTGGAGADDVSVLLNSGNGHAFIGPTNFVVGFGASDLAIADFDTDTPSLDEGPDLAVLNSGAIPNTPNQFSVSILMNRIRTNGRNRPFDTGMPITISCPALLDNVRTTCTPAGIAAADFNGDGTVDIAVSLFVKATQFTTVSLDGLIQVYTGRGDGTFDFAGQVHVAHGAGPIVAADLTGHHFAGDGRMDIGIAEVANDTVRIVRSIVPPPERPPAHCNVGSQCTTGLCVDHTCCNSPCDTGEYCDIPGHAGTCSPPAANGSLCSTGVQCQSGFCIDGFCCSSGPDACPTDQFCNTGTCAAPSETGTLCSDNQQCANNQCVDGACCASDSCPDGESCNIPGSAGRCVPAFGLGTPCANANQCASTFCVDSYCCSTDSCPAGQACDMPFSLGQCAAVPTQPPTPTFPPAPTVTPTPQPMGAACADGPQCESTHCVDGVCCSSPSCSPGMYCDLSFFTGGCHAQGAVNDACKVNHDCLSAFCAANGHCAPAPTATPTATATPLGGGAPCSSTSQCQTGLTCNDEGVCCTTATCPPGESCRNGGVCAVLPTPTATATPKSANGLSCNSADDCQSGNCMNSTCCASDCQDPMRCDILNNKGTCSAPLAEGQACEKTSDCELNLVCNCGANFICMVDTPQGFCDLPPTPGPTLPPPNAQCGPDQVSLGNGECADVSASRSGGCSMGDRGANGGAWLFAVAPLALGFRRLSRRHARVHLHRHSANQ